MIVYVELTHTVPIDVGDAYDGLDETTDRATIAQRAAADSAFYEWLEGPYDVADADWSVITDVDHMERLDAEHVTHVIEARPKARA